MNKRCLKTPFELTPTERKVLELNQQGLPAREIARMLGWKAAANLHGVLIIAREKERLMEIRAQEKHAGKDPAETMRSAHNRCLGPFVR